METAGFSWYTSKFYFSRHACLYFYWRLGRTNFLSTNCNFHQIYQKTLKSSLIIISEMAVAWVHISHTCKTPPPQKHFLKSALLKKHGSIKAKVCNLIQKKNDELPLSSLYIFSVLFFLLKKCHMLCLSLTWSHR